MAKNVQRKHRRDKKELFEQAIGIIKKNPIFFIEDVVAFLPISKPTFYEYFPVDSSEFNIIKDAIDENKTKTKIGIRGKLYKSQKAGELLALYKLICSDEERRMLNQNYTEITGKDGKELNPVLQVEVIDRREQVDNEDTDN